MSKIVSKIAEFLDNEENKDCLYTLMTTYFREKALKSDLSTVFVIVYYGEDTLLGSVPKSTHREADYRIIIHILDAISKGLTKITIYCNDTDIVAISLAFMPVFLQASPQIQVFIQSDTRCST